MKLSDAKQQAIGKHLFVNGKDWGTILYFGYDYLYKNCIKTNYTQAMFLSANILSNLLQGRQVKIRRCFEGVYPRWGMEIDRTVEYIKHE